MEYMSVAEAAEKWQISTRRIQILCSQKRINGASKLGKAWIIPVNAEKPGRKSSSSPAQSRELSDEVKGQMAQMVKAYYGMDYAGAKVKAYSLLNEKNPYTYYNALVFIGLSSVYTGDAKGVLSIIKRLKHELSLCKNELDRQRIWLSLDLLYVELFMFDELSQETLTGNFSEIEDEMVPFAFNTHCKYLCACGKYYQLYGTARAYLNFFGNKNQSVFTIYMNCFMAVTLYFAFDREKGDRYFEKAMEQAARMECFAPVTELMLAMRGGFRFKLNELPAAHRKAIAESWDNLYGNWIAVYNQIHNTQLESVLSFRELCVASLAASGYTNAKIAEKWGSSESSVKKILQDVFITLGISKRSELGKKLIVSNMPKYVINGD